MNHIDRRLRGPVAKRLFVTVGLVLLAHGLAAGALTLLQRPQAEVVAPGVVVAGEHVGGLDAVQLRQVVEDRAASLLSDPVVVTACDEPAVSDRRAVGVTTDDEEAIEEAWAIGRRGFWRALADQVAIRTDREFRVDLERHLDPDRLDPWASAMAAAVSCEPEPARVELSATSDGTRVEPTPGETGRDVPTELLIDAVEEGFDEPGVLRIDTSPASVESPTSEADLEQATAAAETALSAPVGFTNPAGGADVEFEPPELAAILSVGFDPDAPEGQRLALMADADELRTQLDDDLEAIEVAPTNARPTIVDGDLEIEDGEPGFTLDAEAAASRLVALVGQPTERTGELPGSRTEPEVTREGLIELGIEQEVSSFTTSMVAGQDRNLNIRQAADYLDGSLVLPGERLSLNEAIGRRTTARGFVEGGFIRDGEIVEVVGGGVSQMATTFMNAAWFAGVELVEFQPHSLYFTQYPVGRESTMSGNTLDVVFENDSPYGIVVTTDHSDTHVTVSFWSTPWAEVETWTGEPTNRVPGELRDGFDVNFGRTIIYPDGSTEEERYSHRYRPENAPTDPAAPA